MSDPHYCPCGYRGPITSEAPPFWNFEGQVWHWDCLVAKYPERRAELEAAREEALARHPQWKAWVADLDGTAGPDRSW